MKKSFIIILLYSFIMITSGYAQTTALYAGTPPNSGDDPTGNPAKLSAHFNQPFGIVYDGLGNLYISDMSNHKIKMIHTDGLVYTRAGSGEGWKDASGIVSQFDNPCGLAVGSGNEIYVADKGNNCIRKITAFSAIGTAQTVTTFAGAHSTTGGFLNGTGTAAKFNTPVSVAVDVNGNIYVSDYGNNCIRKITSAGVVTTFAGVPGATGGDAIGPALSAKFNGPTGIYVTSTGDVYVCDSQNGEIKKISGGQVTMVVNVTAGLFLPDYVYVHTNGDLYIADNTQIWKYSGSKLRDFAGDSIINNEGYAEGTGTAAQFNIPKQILFYNNLLYVSDQNNNCIRTVTLSAAPPSKPIAAFGYTPTTVNVNSTVTFTDKSTNGPMSWKWTLTPNSGFSYTSGSSTSQNPSIKFITAKTTYTVKLKVTNAGGSDSTTQTIYINPLGIADEPVFNYKIYPSPTIDKLNIETGDIGFDNITISNLLGKVIYRFSSITKLNRFTIDVSAFNPGMYLLNISDGNANYTSKFIKK